jgi:hypothetical protein
VCRGYYVDCREACYAVSRRDHHQLQPQRRTEERAKRRAFNAAVTLFIKYCEDDDDACCVCAGVGVGG